MMHELENSTNEQVRAPDVWSRDCPADQYRSLPQGGFDTGGYLLALVYEDGSVKLAATVHPPRIVALFMKGDPKPCRILLSHPVLRYERLKRKVLKAVVEQGIDRLGVSDLTEILRGLDYRVPAHGRKRSD